MMAARKFHFCYFFLLALPFCFSYFDDGIWLEFSRDIILCNMLVQILYIHFDCVLFIYILLRNSFSLMIFHPSDAFSQFSYVNYTKHQNEMKQKFFLSHPDNTKYVEGFSFVYVHVICSFTMKNMKKHAVHSYFYIFDRISKSLQHHKFSNFANISVQCIFHFTK